MNKVTSAAISAREAAPRREEGRTTAQTAQPTAARAKQTRTMSDMQNKTTNTNQAISCT
jgi:hypothetical protein